VRAPSTYRDRIEHWDKWLASTDAAPSQRQSVERLLAAYLAVLAGAQSRCEAATTTCSRPVASATSREVPQGPTPLGVKDRPSATPAVSTFSAGRSDTKTCSPRCRQARRRRSVDAIA
jgi:hypothetical protein